MEHPPAYHEYENQPKPEINWDTANNSWVGIWGYDWADVIGTEILKVGKNIEFEVWQPDLRADKVYSHKFESGLIHKLFPATYIRQRAGFKISDSVYSKEIVNELKKNQEGTIVTIGLDNTIFFNEIRNLKIPILHSFLGLPDVLLDVSQTNNPLKYFLRLINRERTKSFLKKIEYILICSYLPAGEKLLKGFVKRKIYTNMIGIDLEKYKPNTKSISRKRLNIGENTFLAFTNSRLVGIKQIDRLILACRGITNIDYKLIISGHGTREYEVSLKTLTTKYNLSDKIIFTGFLSENELLDYYSACDLFINVTKYDGGPVSVWKAIAMGIPVFNTNIGNAYHFLKEKNAGYLVDKNNFEEWEIGLKKIFSRELKLTTPNLVEVHNLLNWEIISKKSVEIYYEIFNDYAKNN